VTNLKEDQQIKISEDLGVLYFNIFRVEHMSPVTKLDDIQDLLNV